MDGTHRSTREWREAIMAVASVERVHTQPIVLDIGEDIGALIVYTSSELRGREIEVSPKGHAARRTHTEVLERTVTGRTVWAAVFPALAAGDYSLWRDVLTDDEAQAGRLSRVNPKPRAARTASP